MSPELYVWKAPLPRDADEAEALVRAWRDSAAGAASGTGAAGESRAGVFESSDDVTWFSRELTGDAPPVWNPDRPATREHPDRVVVVPLEAATLQDTLGEVYGLATKYDLVVYDPQRGALSRPQAELAAYASATFWPRGAIRAFLAGVGGGLLAFAAWIVGVPILSGIAVVIGVFLLVMAVYTFIHEGRVRLRAGTNRRS
jgi:hypothetical protein